jgi:CheY-like chemotaxis protein
MEVLCVDDEPINQTVVRELLQSSGFKVTSAMSGPEAIELLAKRAREPSGVDGFPNLVLMDFMMPGMTGIEATQRIRLSYPDAAMPIIMLSANNDEDTVVQALSSGCSDYINKPFKAAELLARVGLQTKALLQEVRQLEARQHEALLERILPKSVIDRLKSGQRQIADELDEVTIVFSDIVGFTSLTSQVSTRDIVGMLDQLFVQLDHLTDKHGVYKVETIGKQQISERRRSVCLLSSALYVHFPLARICISELPP